MPALSHFATGLRRRAAGALAALGCWAALAALTACSGSAPAQGAAAASGAADASDSAIYRMGQEAADAMLVSCRSLDEVHAELLDVRSRGYLIATRVDTGASEMFIQGFEERLKERCDTLYRLIKGAQ